MSGGGQRRTLFCPCGFVSKGSIREANMRFKMHQKKCVRTETNPASLPFDALTNGRDGMTTSRNGNTVRLELQADIATTNDLGEKYMFQVPLKRANTLMCPKE